MRESFEHDLQAQLDRERDAFRECATTADFGEALDAFSASGLRGTSADNSRGTGRAAEGLMSLRGRTLFITGASRGIGLAIALRAARDGARVAVAAKTAEPHPKLRGQFSRQPRRSRRPAARRSARRDVRSEADVTAAVEKTAAAFGGDRHLRQQRVGHQAHGDRGHLDEAVRPDASGQHAGDLPRDPGALPASRRAPTPTC